MLVFEERGKPEFPEKNLSEQSREPTNSAHIWRRVRESNPGPGIEPGTHWWKASALTTTPTLLPDRSPFCSKAIVDAWPRKEKKENLWDRVDAYYSWLEDGQNSLCSCKKNDWIVFHSAL